MFLAAQASAPTRTGRSLAVRIARTAALTFLLILLGLFCAPRLNSYLLARQFQKVLAGLQTVQIDETTEDQLLRQVPYLAAVPHASSGEPEHWYFASFTNERSWLHLERFVSRGAGSRRSLLKLADWAGFHYVSLTANVIVLDGKVSSVRYSVASEFAAPRVLGDLVSVRSVHGYWLDHRLPLLISSTDDQSPDYRIKESVHRPSEFESIESSLAVSYAFDASREKIANVFKPELSCFWRAAGCRNWREILPLVSQEETAIKKATLTRLQSGDPCPDSLLAARIRYLPDLDVSIVEVTNSGPGYAPGANGFLYWTPTAQHTFRVLELITGQLGPRSPGPFLHTLTIASPVDPKQKIPDPSIAAIQNGGRMLMFGNHSFESCSIVTATDSAEAAVRAAVSAAKRSEDQIVTGLQ
jgi:hypothetical protein